MTQVVQKSIIEKKRADAKENLLSMSFPDRVSHLWRYSDPKWFDINNSREIFTQKVNLAFSSIYEYLQKGVIFEDLGTACFKHEKLLSKKFGELTKENPDKITTLNEANWSGGFFLYVPSGIEIKEPLVVKFAGENLENVNKYVACRSLIVLEEGASVSLVDEVTSAVDNLLTNFVLEVFLEKGSRLNYLNLQLHDERTVHHFSQKALVGENAELNNLIVALGGKTSKANLGADLSGNGASTITYGIVLGDGAQRFDHHTKINHLAPYTKSHLSFRVALKDKSHSAYTGNLKILHEAIKSDAHQENRNLLLSQDAKAESIPELEILTNDVVRCNHGVTMGKVDKDQIYYLMSRGLNQKDAERLVIQGFLEPTISRIPEGKLKEELLLKINSKLENI